MTTNSAASTVFLSRIAGALLLAGEGEYFLIGNTKEPCDWSAAGFDKPAEGDAASLRVRRLTLLREHPAIGAARLTLQRNGRSLESMASTLADRLLIVRNASFSERLWRIVTEENDDGSAATEDGADVSWLVAMPNAVWEIVREAALKCL